MKEGAHAEITGIYQEDCISMAFALFPDEMRQPRVPALLGFPAAFREDTLRKEIRVEVMGEKYEKLPFPIPLACSTSRERESKNNRKYEQYRPINPLQGSFLRDSLTPKTTHKCIFSPCGGVVYGQLFVKKKGIIGLDFDTDSLFNAPLPCPVCNGKKTCVHPRCNQLWQSHLLPYGRRGTAMNKTSAIIVILRISNLPSIFIAVPSPPWDSPRHRKSP